MIVMSHGFSRLRLALGAACLVFTLVAVGDASRAQAAAPPEYADMYASLSSNLDSWQTAVNALPPASGPGPIFSAHVLAANANRGTALLGPTTMPAVDLTLDRLKELGVGGVTVSVSFPLLNADYPNASSYLTFYQTVAQHVRARGLGLSVEQHIAFHDTPFSTISFDFSQLPFAQFESEFHTMSQLIIDNMHPDYLTVLSEPDTFTSLTGYQQASTPSGAVAMVETIVSGLQRGTTKIGAGSGSWLANSPAYASAFAASSMDYVDLHIYPIMPGSITNAQAMVDAAHAGGKPVVLDEAWMYKLGANEAPPTNFNETSEVFKRDNYSFWSPLDAQFLGLLKQFAQKNGIKWVAPFWTTYFWAYVDYGPATQNLTYQQTVQLTNQAAYQAMQNDTFTSTADAWRFPATTAPVGGVAEQPAALPASAAGSTSGSRRHPFALAVIALAVVVAAGAAGWWARGYALRRSR
jgi:hypothetical protein